MSYETIIYEKKDHVGWITLNRPEVLNAQNNQMRKELIEVLEMIRDDDDVRAIVLMGAGDKAFSAGADISEFPSLYPTDQLKKRAIKVHYELIREIPKPVIAMVNGFALGGGCEITLASDIVIASENSQFGQPEVRVGIIPGGGGTQVLPRLVGEKKAKELIFTGRIISAQEALQIGLVNQVVPKEKLRETVDGVLKMILAKSPVILKIAKMAVNKSLETTLSTGLAYEKDLFAICFGTEDQKEAARAFLEKRDPVYKGR
ncbi:MAG: enoyl-CoA hydratase/isomerase family protein [Chloroflexi bacterium]|nr:enoyl-CoA hydratase/isomerase family protein [Chloroflexota bacterium]